MTTKFKPGTVALTKTQRAYIAGARAMQTKIAEELYEAAATPCTCERVGCSCNIRSDAYFSAAEVAQEVAHPAPPYEAPLFSYRNGPAAYDLQIGRLWFRFIHLTGGPLSCWGRWIGEHFFERFTFGWERDE